MRAEVERYPEVCLRSGTVTDLQGDVEAGFTAVIDGAHRVTVARVVLASGVSDQLPRLDGFAEHYGADVHHCPACDGYEIRGQDIIVLGAGDQVSAFASELLDWAATVRIVTDSTGPAFDAGQRRSLDEHGIEVVGGPAAALVGEPGDLAGVRLEDGRCVPGSSLFFSYAHLPANDLAAGDLTPGLQLVVIARGQGVSAGVACATSLRGSRPNEAGPDPAPPTRRFAPAP